MIRRVSGRRALLAVLAAIWIGTIALVTGVFMQSEFRAGAEAAAPKCWPSGTPLQRVADGPTLVMVVHPKCPCTRASIEQLIRICSRSTRPLRGYVIFPHPRNENPGWSRTAFWNRVAEVPGLTPVEDVDGREAARFGTSTSGQVLLYGADGLLRFVGGLTAARGVEGESAGVASVLDYLEGRPVRFARTPTFGCALGDLIEEKGP